MTDAPLTIYERMVAILTELPPIGKDQRNQQQNFMFRGHDDVLNALNPLLAKHGVFVTPHVLERVVDQRTTAKGSIMYEVNLHVQYTFNGAAGDFIMASTWGEGTDMGDKATNKAMTMAFKNVLNQAFAISNKEVTDADAESPEPTVRQEQVTNQRPKSWAELDKRMGELIGDPTEAKAWLANSVQALYGKTTAELSKPERDNAFQKLSTGYLALSEAERNPLGFLDAQVIQATLAGLWDGLVVEAPVLDDPEAEQIPFGDAS